MPVIGAYSCFQRINARVSRNKDVGRILFLIKKILTCKLSGSKVQLGYKAYSLTVELLGIWRENIVSPQSRFNMTHLYARIEAGKSSYKSSGSIAVNKNKVRLFLCKHFLDGRKHGSGYIKKVLTLFHYPQVIFGSNFENIKHLPEHFLVLTRNAYHCFNIFS